MSDFAQHGLISTLQQLNPAHLIRLEKELGSIAQQKPIALILPCHGTDLERPALGHILNELRGATFISEIIVSANGLDAAGYARARTLFSPLPQPVRILWNDAPQVSGLLDRVGTGKGLNIWTALGLLCAEGRAEVIALQDCDVASFQRGTLARLCYACAHPSLGYSFAKMYYSRATDRLYGRVSRLFFTPLLHAIVRLVGHRPLVDFLLSFRYPLAGECALTRDVASRLPLSSNWGLETAMLCEVFRHIDPRQVCQVDGGSGYDHKHQPALSALSAMCGQIAQTLFFHLEREGLAINAGFRQAIPNLYRREAQQALRRSNHLALINGLPFEDRTEESTVESFAAQLETPPEAPSRPLPAWSMLARTESDFIHRLAGAFAEISGTERPTSGPA